MHMGREEARVKVRAECGRMGEGWSAASTAFDVAIICGMIDPVIRYDVRRECMFQAGS
jgi:hypothetical protein